MKTFKMLGLGICLGLYCVWSTGLGEARTTVFIDRALSDPNRPRSDLKLDLYRRPADMLMLTNIQPGMHVADLMAGSGWYTEILSRVVGPTGLVYVQNNRISAQNYGNALKRRLESSELENVIRIDQELEELRLPSQAIDIVFLIQFYHDTYWMGVDRVRMNQNIYHALKPGGMYCVIDHRAEANTGSRDTKYLHRVDPKIVEDEILAAGFELTIVSDLLHNPNDDHSKSVFDRNIRGQTDRFLFIFQKPVLR